MKQSITGLLPMVEKKNNAPIGIDEYWNEYWNLLDATKMNFRLEYTDVEFCSALEAYRNIQIEDSMKADNPMVRMFEIWNKRVGKRPLEKLNKTAANQPVWLHNYTLCVWMQKSFNDSRSS